MRPRMPGGAAGSTSNVRTGSAMFLTWRVPASTKRAATLACTWSCTGPEIMTPPGFASACRRAARLTVSPNTPDCSSRTSPSVTPMRSTICRSRGRAEFSAATRSWIASAAATAFTALWNSAMRLSPTLPNSRPPKLATWSSKIARRDFSAASVPGSSAAISRL